jgi:type IV pilus assembly protein PilW
VRAVSHLGRARHRQRGLSMIELMIALVLGLLVIAGILTLLSSVRQASATQSAIARLQENGRAAIDTMAADFRSAGFLPCGSHESPLVYADGLNSHISPPLPLTVGAADVPYPLDKSIFILGSACDMKSCTPTADSTLPPTGLKDGQRLPGTDIVTARYLDGEGIELGENVSCATGQVVRRIALRRPLTAEQRSAFAPQHVGLLASCKSASVVPVDMDSDAIQIRATVRGAPACASVDRQTRLFDFDAQMRTITYFLRVDKRATGQLSASLIRRINGVDNEVVDGVERMNIRYSFTDNAGMTHWVAANEVGSKSLVDSPRCGSIEVEHLCGWGDMTAVDISLLVNTVDELPIDSPAVTNTFHYSPDGNAMQSPGAEMPMTGLPTRRLLRREFHTVVALRNLSA